MSQKQKRPATLDTVRREPWDRLPNGEGPKAYAQFRCYLELIPEDRTYTKAWERWRTRANLPEGKPCPSNFRTMAHKNDWRGRADAFDADQNRKIESQLAARRTKALIATADLGETLRKKAEQAARMLSPIDQQLGDREGKEVWLVKSQLTPTEIARMAQVGVELEQLAMGNPTTRTEHTGAVEVSAGGQVTLANAKQELARKVDEMRMRYQDVQNRLQGMTTPADGPKLLPGTKESAA